MTSELKPCPFCGGEAELVCNDIGAFVGCFHENCPIGPQTSTYLDGYATEAEAIAAWNARADYHGYEQAAIEAWESIKAWNTRAERTCRSTTNKAAWCFVCNECGKSFPRDRLHLAHNHGEINYCPNCGAKVVGE